MKKKLMYEVPDAELIELKLENNQMQAESGGVPGSAANGYGDNELDDLGD